VVAVLAAPAPPLGGFSDILEGILLVKVLIVLGFFPLEGFFFAIGEKNVEMGQDKWRDSLLLAAEFGHNMEAISR